MREVRFVQLQVGQRLLVSRLAVTHNTQETIPMQRRALVQYVVPLLLADLMICASLRSAEGGYTHDVEPLGLHMTRLILVSNCESAPVSGSQR